MGSCDVWGIVERHNEVTIEYLNLEGVKIINKFAGFTSVIIQHEIDHLQGKVFIHKIKDEKNLHIVFPSETKEYRNNYKKWKRTLNPKIYWKDVVGKK